MNRNFIQSSANVLLHYNKYEKIERGFNSIIQWSCLSSVTIAQHKNNRT